MRTTHVLISLSATLRSASILDCAAASAAFFSVLIDSCAARARAPAHARSTGCCHRMGGRTKGCEERGGGTGRGGDRKRERQRCCGRFLPFPPPPSPAVFDAVAGSHRARTALWGTGTAHIRVRDERYGRAFRDVTRAPTAVWRTGTAHIPSALWRTGTAHIRASASVTTRPASSRHGLFVTVTTRVVTVYSSRC